MHILRLAVMHILLRVGCSIRGDTHPAEVQNACSILAGILLDRGVFPDPRFQYVRAPRVKFVMRRYTVPQPTS
jgi:hypothetical protein